MLCYFILVQKAATVDLLLGTNLLTQLGSCVLKTSNKDGQKIDLLQRDVWRGKGLTTIPVITTDESSTGALSASEQLPGKEVIQVCVETGKSGNANSQQLPDNPDKAAEQGKSGGNTEFRLLKAVRLPGKIVTGSAAKALQSMELLLDPNLRNLDNNRVIVTEALVKVDQQNRVKVLVENHKTFPSAPRSRLGVLQPMGVVSPDKLPKALHLEADTLNEGAGSKTVNTEKLFMSRTQELLDQLDIILVVRK